MIVWLNGAFGAGKTTLAEELNGRLPEAMQFDPEEVGYVLRQSVPMPDSNDFQEIPLWRALVADWAIRLHAEYGKTLIIPMTLVNNTYQREIFGLISKSGIPFRHFFIDVTSEELRRRIDAQILIPHDPERDAEARAFRASNIDRCIAARADLPPGTIVLPGGDLTPAQLADAVLREIRMAPVAVG